MHSGPDLTPSVETGLAIFYLVVALMNGGYGVYQQVIAKNARQGFLWYFVGGFFLLHFLIFALHYGVPMPHWLRDLSDQGLQRGLITLGLPVSTSASDGMTLNDTLVLVNRIILGALIVGFLADLALSYAMGDGARKFADGLFGKFCKRSTLERMVIWSLLISIVAVIYSGTGPVTYFVLASAVFAAAIVWRGWWTQPAVAWALLNAALLFGGWSMTDYDFRNIIVKPDNVPIVGLVFIVGFFTWLTMRKAVINDERIARGLPPTEKEEDEKVLVWPDLVYTELICMVIVTVILVVWSVALPAPLEQPASSTKTPNPSKAPWYFLGLQEMLVYYDPWLAGVVFPTFIITGLMAIPYMDFNQKGNGYFTFNERPFSIITFLFGFIVLWVVLIFLGTFLRGPNWNFFGLYEPWDPHKLVPLNNVNLSDYVWVRGLGTVFEQPPGGVSILVILQRESPGILAILFYFLVLPPLLAKTIFRTYFIRMGFIRYFIMSQHVLFMAALPIKMVLRWTMNLKYIVAIPEYFFNI
jgi:hypothetical protein